MKGSNMKTTQKTHNSTTTAKMPVPTMFSRTKWLLAASIGTLLAVCATISVHAQTTATTTPTGVYQKIADITTQLLAAPLTSGQRQVLHAQNFNQLAPSARAAYLHTVAYAIGYAVASGG